MRVSPAFSLLTSAESYKSSENTSIDNLPSFHEKSLAEKEVATSASFKLSIW